MFSEASGCLQRRAVYDITSCPVPCFSRGLVLRGCGPYGGVVLRAGVVLRVESVVLRVCGP